MSYQDFLVQHKLSIHNFPFDGSWRKLDKYDPNNSYQKPLSLLGSGTPESPKTLLIYDFTESTMLASWGEKRTITTEEDQQLLRERETIYLEIASSVKQRYEQAYEALATSNFPYLEKKGFSTLHFNFRKIENSNLLLPITSTDGKMWSLQAISPDGAKYFEKGGKIAGNFINLSDFTIKHALKNKFRFILCEGFATGYSLTEMLKLDDSFECVVLACLSLGNVEKVIEAIREIDHKAEICLALDHDVLETGDKGPGYLKARELSHTYQTGVFLPPEKGDWNDFHQKYSLKAMLNHFYQYRPELPDEIIVIGLDDTGKSPLVTSTRNQRLMSLTGNDEKSFAALADENYYKREYPHRYNAEKNLINYSKIYVDIAQQARDQQRLDTNFLGTGFYYDKVSKKPFLHCGNVVYDGKKTHHVARFQTKLGRAITSERVITPPKIKDPTLLDDPDYTHLRRQLLNWLKKSSWVLKNSEEALVGWLTMAQYTGGLDRRPGLLLLGNRGSGKSSIIENIITPILERSGVFSSKATTAGWTQSLKFDAVPSIMDEAEYAGTEEAKGKALMEMIRSSYTGQKVTKGSASGVARDMVVRSSVLLAAINPPPMQAADISRFITLNMKVTKEGRDDEGWIHRRESLSLILTPELIEHFFSYTFHKFDLFLSLYADIHPIIEKFHDSRVSDTVSPIMAGYFLFIGETKLRRDQIIQKYADWKPIILNTTDESDSPQEEIIERILSHQVRCKRKHIVPSDILEQDSPHVDRETAILPQNEYFEPTLRELIYRSVDDPDMYRDVLDTHGIIVSRDTHVVRFMFCQTTQKATGISNKATFYRYFKNNPDYEVVNNRVRSPNNFGKQAILLPIDKVAPDQTESKT